MNNIIFEVENIKDKFLKIKGKKPGVNSKVKEKEY